MWQKKFQSFIKRFSRRISGDLIKSVRMTDSKSHENVWVQRFICFMDISMFNMTKTDESSPINILARIGFDHPDQTAWYSPRQPLNYTFWRLTFMVHCAHFFVVKSIIFFKLWNFYFSFDIKLFYTRCALQSHNFYVVKLGNDLLSITSWNNRIVSNAKPLGYIYSWYKL